VQEQLSFTCTGTGEHAFVQIEKCAENSEFVARQLARFAGVEQRHVGYAGLKDRQAITTQWFSVWLPGRADPDWREFHSENFRVLNSVRHARKLKRGALAGNYFQILIRNWRGDRQKTVMILDQIARQGLPNYFGEQRFGWNGNNIHQAVALFNGRRFKRHQKSLYLSAARAFLFNEILAERIRNSNWKQVISGDVLMFSGSHSIFKAELPDTDIDQRLAAGKIHPAGLLWGEGENLMDAESLQLVQQAVEQYPVLAKGLEQQGLKLEYRALRVFAQNLRYQFLDATTIQLQFTLPAGSYATALIREFLERET